MMSRQSAFALLALLGAATNTLACVIPTTPLSNNITQPFSIFVQNASLPLVHNRIMNFRPNGLDKHLVLRPMGEPTFDLIYLENGRLMYDGRHAVIDLEHNDADDTTKMFMTDRTYPTAIFQPVYGCDPDTDAVQIRLKLVSRLTDPPEIGGQIGIQTAGDTYEFRYSPAANPLLNARWFTVAMVVFRDGLSPPTPTTSSSIPAGTPASIGDYDFVSCWAEPPAGRTLPTSYTAADMTNEKCASLCASSAYMGTQYGVECWCGPSLAAGSAAAPATDCAAVCPGNGAEICGGGRRLSLYKLKSGSSSSSIISTTSSKSSSTSSTISSTTSSQSSSTSSTSSSTSSSSSSTTTSSSSSTSSSKSSTTFSTLPSSSSSKTSTTSSTAPTSTAGLPAVGKYNFVSCYAEPPTGRALTGALTGSEDMTLEKCASLCTLFPYFGTEWSKECWCGNTLTAGSAPAPLSDCNYPCIGAPTEMCGGSQRLSLYHNDGYTAPQQPGTVGSYNFYGCVTDLASQRTLATSSLSSSTMTLQMCATFCSGHKYFGAEWGVECWCGDTLAAGSALVDVSQCSMTCGGNSGQLCGNGVRLSVYQLAAV